MSVDRAGKYQAEQTVSRCKIKREGGSASSPAPRSEEGVSARRLEASRNQRWCPKAGHQNGSLLRHHSCNSIHRTHPRKEKFQLKQIPHDPSYSCHERDIPRIGPSNASPLLLGLIRVWSNQYQPGGVLSPPETKHQLPAFYGLTNNRKYCCAFVGTTVNGETKAFVTQGPNRLVADSRVPEAQFNDRFVAVISL